MANGYTQKFTLSDLFNNSALRRVLPQVNYKEITTEDGKVSKRTNMRSVNRIVFDTSESVANRILKNVISARRQDNLEIIGEGDIARCSNEIYLALMRAKGKIEFTANDMGLIRSALKQGMKQKATTGKEPMLYLKAQSIMQIKTMTTKQLRNLLNDVMENIYFNGEFYDTQKKFDLPSRLGADYEQSKQKFDNKVGNV